MGIRNTANDGPGVIAHQREMAACKDWYDSLGSTLMERARALTSPQNPPSYPYALGVAQAVITELLEEISRRDFRFGRRLGELMGEIERHIEEETQGRG